MAISETDFLKALFHAAVSKAMPGNAMAPFLPEPPKGRTVVVGAGKASAAMAAALERLWQGPLEGIVVTRYDYGVHTKNIEIIEAAHPVPDQAGLDASERILSLAAELQEDDLMIALISGGGSSLLQAPLPGISLEDMQGLNAALLQSGASIREINCVRKHLCRAKGGRLAALAYPARTVGLLISDIPGDDPALIASGPTVAERTSLSAAREVLARYSIRPSRTIEAALHNPENETPSPDSLLLSRTKNKTIVTPQASLEAAAEHARANNITPIILGNAIEGEAREVGKVMAAIAKQVREHGQPFRAPCVLLSGGETTVTVRGKGRGGRNVEFLLGFINSLDNSERIWAIAGDTDGVDGAEEVAGAVVTPTTRVRANALGYRVETALAQNDGHGFFEKLNDQLVTGPTLTNVNDFRAILIR